MTQYDVKRLALVLALKAETEGMKAVNQYRQTKERSPIYGYKDFAEIANQLRELAAKHDHQL